MTFHTFFYYPSQSFFFPVVSETCTANSQNIWLNSNKPLVLYWRVFSCGSARKESGRPRFNPWVGKIPWRRERPPTLVFCPREFHGLYWRKLGLGGGAGITIMLQMSLWESYSSFSELTNWMLTTSMFFPSPMSITS